MSDRDQLGFEDLFGLWEEGAQTVGEVDVRVRRPVEEVVAAIVQELRRRLGGTFTTSDLARFYMANGTEWCFELATRTAPATPEAWDIGAISGAAFVRAARLASDFGGGRRIADEA
jgi:hypothetical protein